jgi:hypothetical protein
MIALGEEATNGSLTLGQRLAEGPLALTKALSYAAMLAEALREFHASGRTYGALSPANIAVTATGVELVMPPQTPEAVTGYTAPELLQGQAADARSDIFAFGTIVYELVTGRPAFEGDGADALAGSLTHCDPAPSGIPAIDRLVRNCIAKDPAVRCQNMRKAILELKLIPFTVHCADAATRNQGVTNTLRAEIRGLAGRLSEAESELASARERAAHLEEFCRAVGKQVEEVQHNFASVGSSVAGLREGVDVLTEGATVLRERVGERMDEFEHALKSQKITIASVAAGQAQTDDVVEGVVAAMELLHKIVVDRGED